MFKITQQMPKFSVRVIPISNPEPNEEGLKAWSGFVPGQTSSSKGGRSRRRRKSRKKRRKRKTKRNKSRKKRRKSRRKRRR